MAAVKLTQKRTVTLRVTTCLENLNVREFDSCQGNVRDLTKSQGNVREKWPKLFIVSCIFASILDFTEFVHIILVSDHALLPSYHHH